MVNDPKRKPVLIRFGHCSNIYTLIASLGLFNSTLAMSAENYETQMARPFRSSKIAPFNANIGFVLFKCDTDTYKIQVLVNELPVDVFGSTDSTEKSVCNGSVCDYVGLRRLVLERTGCVHDSCTSTLNTVDTMVSHNRTIKKFFIFYVLLFIIIMPYCLLFFYFYTVLTHQRFTRWFC
jgi:hypothetical protein